MDLFVTIQGVDYPLATTLRVAYIVQGQNNHAPYSEIFQKMDTMKVEQQVDVVYAAFKCANPDAATDITATKFRDEYLDHYNLGDLMKHLQGIVQGIMGKELLDETSETGEAEAAPEAKKKTKRG